MTITEDLDKNGVNTESIRRRLDKILINNLENNQNELTTLKEDLIRMRQSLDKLDDSNRNVIGWVNEKREQERQRQETIKKVRDSMLGYIATMAISAVVTFGAYVWHLWERTRMKN